jgi:sorbitol-specific phosphotransferase system component IIC
MKRRYNYTYIYIIIVLIFLTVISYIKQENEGFQARPWYKSDYFIIPFLATLVLIGPILYLFYKFVLVKINQSFTEPVES